MIALRILKKYILLIILVIQFANYRPQHQFPSHFQLQILLVVSLCSCASDYLFYSHQSVQHVLRE